MMTDTMLNTSFNTSGPCYDRDEGPSRELHYNIYDNSFSMDWKEGKKDQSSDGIGSNLTNKLNLQR